MSKRKLNKHFDKLTYFPQIAKLIVLHKKEFLLKNNGCGWQSIQ